MREEKVSDFLTRLADRVSAPGGGASAALHAAQAAALLGMVTRYSTGEKYAQYRPVIERIISETDELRGRALQVAEDDEMAFGAIAAAYQLPRDTDAAKAARSAAIASALIGAAQPPAAVIAVAELAAEAGNVDGLAARAEQITAAVREEIRK